MAADKVDTSFSGARLWLAGASVAALSLLAPAAQASTHHHHSVHRESAHHTLTHTSAHVSHATHHIAGHQAPHSLSRRETGREYAYAGHTHHREAYYAHHARFAAQYRHSGLQCVPYAREISHIDLSGDAFLWWAEASGRYARGNQPEVGSVLNFRSIGRMPLGHVAVVTAVLDDRTILVTQANWVRGTINNDVTIQDVSANNDWSDVQVELGDTSTMGSAYPTYGFIYNRPDTGMVIASNGGRNEVAEAPVARPVAAEAPDRNLQ